MKKDNRILLQMEGKDQIIVIISLITIISSVLVIISWLFHIKLLLSLIPGAATMKFNTAFLFLLSGTGMLSNLKKDNHYSLVTLSLGSFILITATLTLLQYVFGINFYIDNLFVTDTFSSQFPGRMSPATAACFILTGIGIIGNLPHFSYYKTTNQLFVILLSLIPFVSLIAYILQIPSASRVFFFNTMAINTSVLFLIISFAISLKSPIGYGSFLMNIYTGSKIIRMLLPMIIIPPVVLSYLLLVFYDNRFIPKDFSIVIYTVLLILLGILYIAIIGVNVNIADKKRRALENRLRAINKELISLKYGIDESTIVAITNTNGIITYVNKKFCKLSKYTKSELLGKTHRIVNSGHHPKEFFKELWSTIKSGNIWEGEIKNRAKDGTFYWVQTSIVPFLDEEGKIYQFLSIRQDITKRKASEELLKAQFYKLERQNKELEQFAYIASHDLQEPLRTISSFSNLFNEEYESKLDEQANQYLHYISQATYRMSSLIKSLLEYSLIGKNSKLQTVDCNNLLKEISRDLRSLMHESGAILEFNNLPTISGYQTELRQLFQNLIINSIKFRKKNVPPHITINFFEEKEHWKFACKDNGIGIPGEAKEKVFVIFQRLHSKSEYEGSGIGLSHCQKIVDLHGGNIWLDSIANQGTTFYFTIPKIID